MWGMGKGGVFQSKGRKGGVGKAVLGQGQGRNLPTQARGHTEQAGRVGAGRAGRHLGIITQTEHPPTHHLSQTREEAREESETQKWEIHACLPSPVSFHSPYPLPEGEREVAGIIGEFTMEGNGEAGENMGIGNKAGRHVQPEGGRAEPCPGI